MRPSLYKQIPGTNYGWHSLAVKLKPASDYRAAIQNVRDAVQKVFAGYKDKVEKQYANADLWMDTTIPRPGIEMKMDLSDGLRFVVLYPVPFSDSASIDQQYAQSVVDLMNRDQKVASAIDGPPTLQAIEKT